MLQRVVLMVAQRLYSTVEGYIDYKENTMEYKKIKMKKKKKKCAAAPSVWTNLGYQACLSVVKKNNTVKKRREKREEERAIATILKSK